MTPRILLFIPCYNCGPQIGRVLNQLAGSVGQRIDEVLVLDNGSQDGTLERATEIATTIASPPITIGRNRENFHLGGSHKAAFAYARNAGFSHVLVLHGDDQGRLDDILPVLENDDHLSYDACLGARFMSGASPQGYSRVRHFGNLAFNLLFSIVSGRRIHDLGSGLNLFGRAVFTDPFVERASDDLRFNIYLLLRLIDGRSSMKFFPISWREEDQQSNVRLFSQALKTLAIAWQFCVRKGRFRAADHRSNPITAYAFEIVARNVPITADLKLISHSTIPQTQAAEETDDGSRLWA